LRRLALIAALIVLAASPQARAADPVPGGACGTGGYITNSFMWAGAPENAGLLNGMFCNGSTWAGVITFKSTGNVGIGTTTPANTLNVAGTVKLGSTGVAFTAMGSCIIASYTPTSTASNQTCTGVPASASVEVDCSPSGAFSTPNTTVLNVRATGTANQIAVNTSAANTNAVSLACTWVQP
jgi:hypothetical protein